jgi:hypothetical protein
MTTGDIKLIREFVAAAPAWYDSISRPQRGCACVNCGVIPDRMKRLAKTLEAFLAAYDLKYGTTKGHSAR